MLTTNIFETSLEKLARILARQYGVNIVFEGNIPCTDGKTIFMPVYNDLTEEMYRDYQGFLDHEVGHCLFTEMDQLQKCISEYHNLFVQNIEDYRQEKEMAKMYPGTALNLVPLNDKLRAKMNDDWMKRPWPIRLLTTVRDITEGRPHRIDDDFRKYMDLIEDEMKLLPDVKSTTEVREITERIVRKIVEEYKKSGDGKHDLEKKAEGKPGKGDGKGEPKKVKVKIEKGEPGEEPSGEPGDPSDIKDGDTLKLMTGKKGEKGTEKLHEFIIDVEGVMEEAFTDKAIEEHKEASKMRYEIRGKGKAKVIPVTTRFDKVTDHSGKGNAKEYARSKREAMPLVAGVKNHLERVLKVRENAKWKAEQERGHINPRSLSKLAADKSYREIFREYTKTETNNVAVEVLTDLSGSMAGRKTEVARQAGIAIGEALQALGIRFEMTGFCSEPDHRVRSAAASIGSSGRFGRRGERLDLHVFKSFDSNSLIGISNLKNGSQNPDGECLAWAAKRLSMQKQKRKILIVLSDGQPATGDTDFGLLQADLRARIAEITKFGIEVIGIGIETDYVKEFYPDYVILKDAKDLPKQAMNKIAKMLESGK